MELKKLDLNFDLIENRFGPKQIDHFLCRLPIQTFFEHRWAVSEGVIDVCSVFVVVADKEHVRPCNRILFGQLVAAHLEQRSPPFMEPAMSLPCSTELCLK